MTWHLVIVQPLFAFGRLMLQETRLYFVHIAKCLKGKEAPITFLSSPGLIHHTHARTNINIKAAFSKTSVVVYFLQPIIHNNKRYVCPSDIKWKSQGGCMIDKIEVYHKIHGSAWFILILYFCSNSPSSDEWEVHAQVSALLQYIISPE